MDDLEKYRKTLDHQEGDLKDEVGEFLRQAANAEVPKSNRKEAIWGSIVDGIDEETEAKEVNLWRYVGIAAAVAIIATFSILFFSPESEPVLIATEIGESQIEELPDGSTVKLNASSSISYASDWNREVTLTGEGFFQVVEGERFLVKTANGNVQVLGTSFNVFARDTELEVSCKTGKVQVTIPSKSYEEVLTPGQLVTLKADTVRKMDRLPELMGKWQSGEFYFDDQPFNKVLDELKRQFHIEIEYYGSDQTYTGYFTINDLEGALDMVCLPMGLTYQKTGQNTFAISENAQ